MLSVCCRSLTRNFRTFCKIQVPSDDDCIARECRHSDEANHQLVTVGTKNLQVCRCCNLDPLLRFWRASRFPPSCSPEYFLCICSCCWHTWWSWCCRNDIHPRRISRFQKGAACMRSSTPASRLHSRQQLGCLQNMLLRLCWATFVCLQVSSLPGSCCCGFRGC